MKKIRKILVATNLSRFSLEAVEYARQLAAPRKAQLYLIHVIAPESEGVFRDVDINKNVQNVKASLTYELEQLFTKHFKQEDNVACVIRSGDVCKEIIKFAREESIDLIIMATHGRTGVTHVVMGSVAEKVVRYSSVPVLTIKPQIVTESLLTEEDIEEQLHL